MLLKLDFLHVRQVKHSGLFSWFEILMGCCCELRLFEFVTFMLTRLKFRSLTIIIAFEVWGFVGSLYDIGFVEIFGVKDRFSGSRFRFVKRALFIEGISFIMLIDDTVVKQAALSAFHRAVGKWGWWCSWLWDWSGSINGWRNCHSVSIIATVRSLKFIAQLLRVKVIEGRSFALGGLVVPGTFLHLFF